MQTVFAKVAGLDVHQKFVQCAVRCEQNSGVFREVRRFGTMTRDLKMLAEYLTALGVTHVAMESTAVLWKPVWNILDGRYESLMLVNPQHLKKVPGRKTDVQDAEWIAQLLQCGLLRPSYVPTRTQRDLRDLTRCRTQLEGERTRVINRLHKVLEDANIKLGGVASDIMGVSGMAMLQALVSGERNPERLAKLAKGRMRKKIPELERALEGHLTEHHVFLMQELLSHLADLDQAVGLFTSRIASLFDQFLAKSQVEELDAIPGVNQTTIENVIAEIGVDMSVFPTDRHLCAWAGMAPGNEESGGRRLRSRTRQGNRWLRRALTEAAWAASHSHTSYYAAQFHRLVRRKGKKKALIAVGHSILIAIYHMLKDKIPHSDLGADYFDRQDPERQSRYLVKRLEQLGYTVALTKTPA
jgi:transposase